MKFGKQLLEAAHPAWHDQYIDYKALKQILKQITPASNAQVQSEGDAQLEGLFISTLLLQLQKVNHFFLTKAHELNNRLNTLSIALTSAARELPRSELSGSMQPLTALSRLVYDQNLSQEIRTALYVFTSLCLEVDALRKFSILNYFAVSKVVKKHDKMSQLQLRLSLGSFVAEQPFYTSKQLIPTFAKMQAMIDDLLRGSRSKEILSCSICLEPTSLLVHTGAHRMCHKCLGSLARNMGEVDPSSVRVTPLLGDPQSADGTCAIVKSSEQRVDTSDDAPSDAETDSQLAQMAWKKGAESNPTRTDSQSVASSSVHIRQGMWQAEGTRARSNEAMHPVSAIDSNAMPLDATGDAPAALDLVADVATMPEQLKAFEDPVPYCGKPRSTLELSRSPLDLAAEIRSTEMALGSTFGRSTDPQHAHRFPPRSQVQPHGSPHPNLHQGQLQMPSSVSKSQLQCEPLQSHYMHYAVPQKIQTPYQQQVHDHDVQVNASTHEPRPAKQQKTHLLADISLAGSKFPQSYAPFNSSGKCSGLDDCLNMTDGLVANQMSGVLPVLGTESFDGSVASQLMLRSNMQQAPQMGVGGPMQLSMDMNGNVIMSDPKDSQALNGMSGVQPPTPLSDADADKKKK